MLVVESLDGPEVGRVAKLAHESLSERFGPEWIRTHLERADCRCLVARDVPSNRVVGFAVAEEDEGCEGRLLALAVERVRQGEGVGGALLRQMQDQLVREGVRRLLLEVRADDARACRFYQRHGFQPLGLQDDAYGHGVPAIQMARPLR